MMMTDKSEGGGAELTLSRLPENEDRPENSGWLEGITNTWSFDILVRVIYVSWFLFLTVGVIKGLSVYFAAHGSNPDALFITTVMARMAVVIFFATFMFFVIIRLRPVRKSHGFFPRLAAFLGTFVLMALPLFPAHAVGLTGNIIATALAFIGSSLGIYVALSLGRSVSILPEARRLVISGPYRFVRHPLYAAEEVAIIGTFILYASPYTAGLIIVHGLLQLCRMGYEEQVLSHAFPEYGQYASRTARLIPGVY